MSYATLLDALFALDLTDSHWRKRVSQACTRKQPADEPKLPEEAAMRCAA